MQNWSLQLILSDSERPLPFPTVRLLTKISLFALRFSSQAVGKCHPHFLEQSNPGLPWDSSEVVLARKSHPKLSENRDDPLRIPKGCALRPVFICGWPFMSGGYSCVLIAGRAPCEHKYGVVLYHSSVIPLSSSSVAG